MPNATKKSSPIKATFNLTVVKQEPLVSCTTDDNCKEGEYCMPGACPMREIYCNQAPCPSTTTCPAICVPKPTPEPSCIPRPACLDSRPACKRPEPAEGWCESNSLIVRSRETGVSIMLWDKDNKQEIWCHISKDMANTLYKLNELKNEEISNYI